MRLTCLLGLFAAFGLVVAAESVASTAPVEVSADDRPFETPAGTQFVVPAGWRIQPLDGGYLLTPPEEGSHMALLDMQGRDADAVVAEAWRRSGLDMPWALRMNVEPPPADGWDYVRVYEYDVPETAHRLAIAQANRVGEQWTVVLGSLDIGLMQRRMSQVNKVADRLTPKGAQRESFAGRTAHRLDADRLDALRGFIRESQEALGVPGVSIGLIQDGEVVMAEGFGVRELGNPEPVDAETLYLVASNTKALTTLLLGRLVDEGKVGWDTPVQEVMPGFALGDADTTARVQVQHLVCACTGLPRQDYEWIMEYEQATAASTLATLATMQPTTAFGELYQYSNPLASAGGYVAAHVLHPDGELGAAYDRAMQAEVFGPLGMARTTFDFARAQAGNHARPHGQDVSGQVRVMAMDLNHSVIPMRPAGGAWSSVDDMLRYVRMELDDGRLPDGSRLVSADVIAERRKPKVAFGNDSSYGMGLSITRRGDVEVVSHGGSLWGYKSDMFWLPAHGVGAVILTNGEQGGPLTAAFQRRVLELLFDGRPEAAEMVKMVAKAQADDLAVLRNGLQAPAAPERMAALVDRYRHPALGELKVLRDGPRLVFDFGEWRTPVGTRDEPDGTPTYVMLDPGILLGRKLLVTSETDGRVHELTLRTAQQEYRFRALP